MCIDFSMDLSPMQYRKTGIMQSSVAVQILGMQIPIALSTPSRGNSLPTVSSMPCMVLAAINWPYLGFLHLRNKYYMDLWSTEHIWLIGQCRLGLQQKIKLLFSSPDNNACPGTRKLFLSSFHLLLWFQSTHNYRHIARAHTAQVEKKDKAP